MLDFTVRRSWESSLLNQITQSLTENTRLFAVQVADTSKAGLQRDVAEEASAANARVTVIDASGKVLADSEAHPEAMENHATRPEFVAALQGRIGSDLRRSRTLGIEFLYVAAPVKGGAVRLAYPLSDIRQNMQEIRRTLLVSSSVALVVAIILASLAAQMITRRLQRIMRFAERVSAGEL